MKINDYKEIIEQNLKKYTPIKYPQIIYESIRYSVLNGGKRLRPIITLEVCNMISKEYEIAVPTAIAIEMLHCQSLIHDDLPCMDNDDYRRGKLTNHKVYGEDIALLAGDALLSLGPQLIINETKNVSSNVIIKVLNEYYNASGLNGIISGQVVDMECEGKTINEETLKYIHQYKTGALFKLAVRCGAILANVQDKILDDLTKFSHHIGLAFQISDDILDKIGTKEILGKTPNKDEKVKKLTAISVYGIKRAKEMLNNNIEEALKILRINNLKSEVLNEILLSIKMRVNV